jgi:hypothetical protein
MQHNLQQFASFLFSIYFFETLLAIFFGFDSRIDMLTEARDHQENSGGNSN